MAERLLPSPPSSADEEVTHAFDHLIQHNATTPYRVETDVPKIDTRKYPRQSAAYAPPASNRWADDQYPNQSRQKVHRFENKGYDTRDSYYGSPMGLQGRPYPYQPTGLNDRANCAKQSGTAMNQTSPGSEENNEGQGKLPSGRITAQHGARRPRNIKGRSFKSSSPPKVKINRKQNKGDRPKVPKIDAPLSELTKGYTNIPVRNMEEWVHRPAVTREKEVEKRNGYVTRPMNSFMLYRSAYAERTKMWCLQNNHQVVSSVSGESWPMEPPEIREQYNEYAQIERENHQKAHPGYKFSPSKAQNLPRKRKGIADDSAGEFTSGQDNQDLDWKPPGKKRAKWKLSETQSHGAGYPVSSLLQSQLEYALPFNEPVLNRSTFHATNPGKPLPAPIDNLDMLDQYYEATVHASRSGDYIEDVRYRKTPRPYTQSRSMPPLVGLPGAHHYELLDQEPFGGPVMADLRQIDCQIDPTLSRYTDQTQSFISEQQFREYNDDVLFDAGPGSFEHYNPSDQYDPQSLVWTYGDSKQADVNDDFVKWMEETNDR